MRVFCLFIMMSLSAFAVEVHSQNMNVTLGSKSMTVRQLVNQIEQQSSYLFVVNSDRINLNEKVQVSRKNNSIKEILNEAFAGKEISYRVEGDNIILVKEAKMQSRPSGKKISGLVVDNNGEPIIGASVLVKGTSNGTITDIDGKFILSDISNNSVLVISYVGFATQNVSVNGKSTLKIQLSEDSKTLEEVVVVGYGTMKKQNLTNSVSKMNDDAVKNRVITNLGEAFQGQLAGVQAQATGGGMPGQELTLHIRGMNTINGDSSPLYVIDGVPRNNMSDLNPEDIASVQVLKDASASSIYGARGANGVIVIETKKGTGKPSVSFEGYYGFQNSEKKLDIMDGPVWVAYNMFRRNLNYLRNGGSMKDPQSARPAGDQIPDTWTSANSFTDWQDAILRTAPIQNYQLSASTKGDVGSIYFSAGYFDQQGIIYNSDFQRINTRLNASMNIGKNLQVGVNLSASDSDQGGADINKGSNGNGKEGPLHHALMTSPLMQLNEGTRDWGFPTNAGPLYPNPLEQLKATTDDTKYLRLMTSLWGEYKIMEGLIFKTQFSYNYDGETYEFFQPGNVTYANGNITKGSSNSNNTRDWSIQNTLTFDKSIKEHHVNVLLGQSAEKQKYYLIAATATGWPYETLETLNLASTPTQASTQRTTYANASFFGRVNYDFKDRYLLNVSARYDGSSRFGSNCKWGLFPSISAGWKMNEESFMKDIKAISLLKLRAAWGTSGNDRIGDYAYQALLGTYNASWGGNLVSGTAPGNIANNDLQWESTKSLDFGLDLNLFKNRIQMNFDYYINTTSNLLFGMPIPYTTGFSSIKTNVGSIRNRGWEVDITSHNVVGKFNWSTTLNLSANKNKVLDMGGIDHFISKSWDGSFLTKVGEPVSQFYCYKTDGILKASDFDANGTALVPIMTGQEEGNPKYVDTNKDGKITADDYVTCGNNLPDLTYGITNRFSWNNFDLSILVQGQFGGNVMFMGARQYDNGGGNGGNQFSRWFKCYKLDYESIYGAGENPIPVDYLKAHNLDMSWDGSTPNPVGKMDNNDDRRIYDTTYFRIKNITLGYNCPKSMLKNSIVKGARFYLSMDNVAIFDNYRGYTPESNSFGNSTTMMGVDYCTYPISKRLVFGINVTL